ncbi:hypothetical protein MFLAVUS_003678 [Mucor flavus]|uniref:Uncharacterized protein n=1 Tax=Mucor flavus TaxID=439312 RepID=A0ABP9YTS4_9FUNG
MLSVPQHYQQQQQKFVPEIDMNENNFRGTEKDDDFYFLSQHLNSPGLLIDEQEEEYPADYFNNPPTHFEIANRAFYATINKFTRQSCPDASRRRSPPYSFLENWHLHSIYSKSQQTLLGITPVRPSVLLSGDDFMFTPPFIQQDDLQQQEEQEEEECIIDEPKPEFYTLSPCPDSNGTLGGLLYEEDASSTATHDKQFSDYCNRNPTQENIWMENDRYHLPIHIQQNDDLLLLQHDQVLQQQQQQQQEEEEELYTTDSSSSDEQHCSDEDEEEEATSFNLTNLYDLEEDSTTTSKQDVVQPVSAMTRSSSFLSQKSSSSSVMSYQSLADIMNNNLLEEERNNNDYGSTTINNNPQLPIADLTSQVNNYARNYNDDVEMGARHNTRTTYHSAWTTTGPFIYLLYIWQFLVLWFIPCARNQHEEEEEEREPLL